MVKRSALGVILLAFASLILTACGSASGGKVAATVEVVTGPMVFEPKVITIKSGETTRLNVKNTDTQLHDLTVVNFKGTSKAVRESGAHSGAAHGKELATHISVDPGKTSVMDLTPAASGEYEVFCTVAGHKDAGMTAKLIVK